VRLGVKQLRELFSFTDGPLPVRSSETDDLHTVQWNTPRRTLSKRQTVPSAPVRASIASA